MMETTITFLLLAAPVISLVLLVAWVVAERRNAPLRRRIGLGVAMLVTAIPLAAAFAVAITQLDDNSYYAASIRTILDETTSALEAGEPGFLDRLKEFRSKQRLCYEMRDDLLEKSRAFKADGEMKRKSDRTTPPTVPSLAPSTGEVR